MLRLDVEEFLSPRGRPGRRPQVRRMAGAVRRRSGIPHADRAQFRGAQHSSEYLTGPLDVSWFHEGKETLATRVAQIQTGVHWSEEPLSRVSHLITNVRILSATRSVEDAQEVEVSCKFLVYRNRNTQTEDTLIGKRIDQLRRAGDSWSIFRRTVYINQAVLTANSLSFFV